MVAGGVGANALISSSATDCQPLLCCLQGQDRLRTTPTMTLNNLVPNMPLGIVSSVPPKGLPPGLYPTGVAYSRLDPEMLDHVDQGWSGMEYMSHCAVEF